MVEFKGKYKRISEENYEAMLAELGLNFLLRKAATFSSPVVEITENDGKWKIVSSTAIKSMEINFVFGVPFEETMIDGRRCRTLINREGDDKWITEQIALDPGKKDVHVVRVFTDKGVTMTATVGSVTSVQVFERIQ